MTNKLISIIFTTFILFSCYSKTNSSNEKNIYNNSQIGSYCDIHNKDCEQIAKELGMTIELIKDKTIPGGTQQNPCKYQYLQGFLFFIK